MGLILMGALELSNTEIMSLKRLHVDLDIYTYTDEIMKSDAAIHESLRKSKIGIVVAEIADTAQNRA